MNRTVRADGPHGHVPPLPASFAARNDVESDSADRTTNTDESGSDRPFTSRLTLEIPASVAGSQPEAAVCVRSDPCGPPFEDEGALDAAGDEDLATGPHAATVPTTHNATAMARCVLVLPTATVCPRRLHPRPACSGERPQVAGITVRALQIDVLHSPARSLAGDGRAHIGRNSRAHRPGTSTPPIESRPGNDGAGPQDGREA